MPAFCRADLLMRWKCFLTRRDCAPTKRNDLPTGRNGCRYDKNNVSLHLLPDGFIYFPRGDTCNLEHYRTRTCIVVRKGKEFPVSAFPLLP